jgi:TonB family protein
VAYLFLVRPMKACIAVTILCLVAAMCMVAEPEKKSDSELSRALIGSWEGKPQKKDYPVTEAFVSLNANGTFKTVEILEFLGYYGRREHEGEWRVTNATLISETTESSKPGLSGFRYVTKDRIVSLRSNRLILRSEDGDEDEFGKAPMPAQFPPLLPPHAEEKLILERPTPEYPIDARRNRMEGTGVFKLLTNQKTGAVSSVRILRSTGYKILDEAAVRGLKNWRLRPASGRAVVVPVTFQLRRRV